MRAARLALFGLALSVPTVGLASQLILLVVNPFTVKSPDHRTELRVNPSDRYGYGKATYRATRDGKLLWQVVLPYTMTSLAITDGGVAAGCGEGLTKNRRGAKAITEIDARGKVYDLDTLIDYDSQPVDASPAPLIDGVILDQEHDRLIVRTSDYERKSIESWRTYSLSRAARTRIDDLNNYGYQARNYLLGARYVAGTGDILLDWSTSTGSTGKSGQTFSLIDGSMREVWHEDHPGDFERGKSIEETYQDIRALPKDGCILSTDQAGRFDIRLFRQSRRASYQVDGRVRLLAVTPFVKLIDGVPTMPSVRSVTLRVARSLTIPQIGIQSGLVHDIRNFFVTKSAIVALLGGRNPSILVARLDGTLPRSIGLPKQPDGNNLFLARLTESKYILVSTDAQGPGHAAAWRVDTAKNKLTPLPKFKSFRVTAVTGIPGGGFAVTASEHVPFSEADHLSVYKPDGTLAFDKRQDGYRGLRDELLSPADLTVDSKGRVVVLENIENTIQTFRPTGEFVSTVPVPATKGRQYYLTNIAVESHDTKWIVDSGNDQSLLHISASGKILQAFSPHTNSSSSLNRIECLAVGPDGRLWLTDGSTISKLATNGVVATVVGTKRAGASLGDIGDFQVAYDGRTYVQDQETAAVTVFDRTGRRLYTCSLGTSTPGDFPSFHLLSSGDLVITVNGVAIRFSREGKRLTGASPAIDRMPKIERLPDQSWFRGDLLKAPGGRLAAIGGPDLATFNQELPVKIGFYTPQGIPESQITLPEEIELRGYSAFDGQTVFLGTKAGILAIDRSGKFLWKFRPRSWTGKEELYVSGSQIAVYDGKRKVTWYALPRGFH